MTNVLHVFKQAWGLVGFLKQAWGFFASLKRLKPTLPLKGRIMAFLVWDFQGDR
jgi:hypothetical protein